MWRKGNPRALLVGMQIGAATVESSMGLPQGHKDKIKGEGGGGGGRWDWLGWGGGTERKCRQL